MATYDPYEAVKKIYGLKNDYDQAADAASKDKIKESATQFYQSLSDNGYANTADELSKSNYANSKKIYDKYATAGKTQVNSYLGSLGSQYGLNQAQIDALISTNPAGELSFGGKVIGTPYSNVDGLAYWDDTGTLDGVFDDYINRSGIQKPLTDTGFWNQYNQYVDRNFGKADEIFNMIAGNNDTAGQNTTNRANDLWGMISGDKTDLTADYAKLKDFNYSNPFTTDTGRSVLERYDLAALQGRDNQAAAGGANNGGNIDSYSAANALRQQASLRNLGEQSALAAHDRTVNSGRGILSDQGNYYSDLYNRLGGLIDTEANAASSRNQDYIDLLTKGYIEPTQQFHENGETTLGRLFNQGETTRLNDLYIDETKKNGQVGRDSQRAADSGYVQNNQLAYQFGFTNEDGSIRDKNTDFQAIINDADNKLATATDPSQRQFYESLKSAAAWARDQKQIQYPEYQVYGKPSGNYTGRTTPTLANTEGVDLQKYLAGVNSGDNRYAVDSTERQTMAALANELQISKETLANDWQKAALNGDIQKYMTDSNERIAKIEAEVSRYQIGTAAHTEAQKLLQNEKQFNAQLAESARQFNATSDLDNKKFNASINLDYDYKPTMTKEQLEKAIASGIDNQEVRNDIKYYYQTNYEDYEPDVTYNSTYNSLSGGAQDYFAKIAGTGVNEPEFRRDIISNSERYKITLNDARKIAKALHFGTDWLNDYEYDEYGGLVER